MKAAVLETLGVPLKVTEIARPEPSRNQILLRNRACGVCRTDLHIVDGELDAPNLPLIPGHQIVGEVVDLGPGVNHFNVGDRVGVPWLGQTCGCCEYCHQDKENLCDAARFTGFHVPGGFAEYSIADARFCFSIDASLNDLQSAPLLCGGLIGYRAYRMMGEARVIGFYGFGSAAHLLLQVAKYQDKEVYAFTRPDDQRSQIFARQLGAKWAGGSDERSPKLLDAVIIFAPVGALVPAALKSVRKGGVVVCAGIHMSEIPPLPYEILWGERTIRSVANLTRRDGLEFLDLAAKIPIQSKVHCYPLDKVNDALDDLRSGRIDGSAVIQV